MTTSSESNLTGGAWAPGGVAAGLADLQSLDDQFTIDTYARLPLDAVRGEGTRFWDAEGTEYLDFLAGISVSNVGHCHPKVVAAVQAQVATLLHVSNLVHSEPALRLAERLATNSLGDGSKVFFCNSGAEAIEGVLKLARRAKLAGDFVVVREGFHGRTYGALSATPQEAKQAPFAPLVPGFVVAEPTADGITNAVTERTAAVLIEPIRGESGVHVVPDDVLVAARQACDRVGAALIFDEIQTGLGRTGPLWRFQSTPVVPDALTTAKALGGGFPIGAFIAGPKLAGALQRGDHGSTFAGSPIIAAAAHATLDVLMDPALPAATERLGARLRDGIGRLPGVTEVRGAGLMVGFDLDGGGAPELVLRAIAEEQLLMNATGPATVRLLPPLVVTEAEIDDALARLGRLLA
ncbi:MAG: aminotransferase class III-fold pyridoxal phosphate-dependent enzyme [Solirubrobacteraceae bacterium]|nr:aminotransferase class III-fold pyridoxal phosphate-dependent enzyme [Solirubrobacteraceae bacterium]